MSNKKFTIHDGDCHVNCTINKKKKKLIMKRLFQYCKDNDCVTSETLGQSDRSLIDAPNTLGDILDILNFNQVCI